MACETHQELAERFEQIDDEPNERRNNEENKASNTENQGVSSIATGLHMETPNVEVTGAPTMDDDKGDEA